MFRHISGSSDDIQLPRGLYPHDSDDPQKTSNLSVDAVTFILY